MALFDIIKDSMIDCKKFLDRSKYYWNDGRQKWIWLGMETDLTDDEVYKIYEQSKANENPVKEFNK